MLLSARKEKDIYASKIFIAAKIGGFKVKHIPACISTCIPEVDLQDRCRNRNYSGYFEKAMTQCPELGSHKIIGGS